MRFTRRCVALAALSCLCAGAQAEIPGNAFKIGVLTDMTGTYASMGGAGSVVAAKMAVDDCLKAECKGMKIDVVSADHQNKADVAAAKSREWLDRDGVTAIADITNSAAALAVQKLVQEKGGVALSAAPLPRA